MSIISATRRGFLYQDRFAVAKYLEQLQGKNLKQFYIDYPVMTRKSLDILHVDISDRTIIYEVKSGEEFKKDKRKKESSEVRDAFVNLKEYGDTVSGCRMNIVIRKGFQNSITSYWDKIEYIKARPFTDRIVKQCTGWLFDKLNLPGINNHEDLHSFCQRISLTDFADDEIVSGDLYPDIDDFVLQKINDFTRQFGADICTFEYPSEILMNKLYHTCRLHAGMGTDLHLIFQKIIKDFLVHRKLLDCGYPAPAGRDRLRDELSQEIDQEFSQFLNEPTLATSQDQLTGLTEGDIIQNI